MQPGDRIEDRLQATAELPIMAVVEALEIDFVEIDVRAQVLQHLRRAVAVGDEPRGEPLLPRLGEDRHRPLGRDERLVVGADQNPGVLPERVLHQRLWGRVEGRGNSLRIAQRLRRDPVLTVRTVQIAAEHSKAVGESPGVRVEKWLLLDGIALDAANIAPGNE